MKRHLFSLMMASVVFLLLCTQPMQAQSTALPAYKPDKNQPILTMDKVRPGMQGYGLSVFNGTDIEPFAVEVVSANYSIAPGVGTIWMRCPDPRMQLNGVVQGMSGSPIYLWPDDLPADQRVMGKNGLLIGAFAFGYGRTKDCFVGVKPISLMRDVAQRATTESIKDIKNAARKGSVQSASQMIKTLSQLARQANLPESQLKVLDAYAKLAAGPATLQRDKDKPAMPANVWGANDAQTNTMAKSMLAPMAITSAPSGFVEQLTTLFEPLGIQPVDAPTGATNGELPAWVKPDELQLRPGSSLSVPLAWGDTDMAATGTVTDVLADGTILGFGHAMSNDGKQGIGTINFPVATGFIHLVMPSNDISFKLGGSARIVGTMIRDENSAVICVPEHYYDAATVTVKVNQYQQPVRTFHYNVVRDTQYTPLLSGILPIISLNAISGAPQHNTVYLKTKMVFENDKELEISRIIPGGAPMDMLVSMLPPISLMANNAFESIPLRSMDVELNVVPELQTGSIIKASLDQTEIAPGGEIGINFTILPFGKAERKFRTKMAIPTNTPDGDYQLLIVGSRTYAALMLNSRPHRTQATNTDQLFEAIKMLNGGVDDNVYILMQTREQGLAIGQNELPLLPSSRVALITNPTSTAATPYAEWIEKTVDTGLVIRSNVMFTLGIRSSLAEENAEAN